MVSLWMYQGEEYHQNLLNGEGRDFNLHNNLSVVYCALPAHHPELNFPHPQDPFFFFSLTEGDI